MSERIEIVRELLASTGTSRIYSVRREPYYPNVFAVATHGGGEYGAGLCVAAQNANGEQVVGSRRHLQYLRTRIPAEEGKVKGGFDIVTLRKMAGMDLDDARMDNLLKIAAKASLNQFREKNIEAGTIADLGDTVLTLFKRSRDMGLLDVSLHEALENLEGQVLQRIGEHTEIRYDRRQSGPWYKVLLNEAEKN